MGKGREAAGLSNPLSVDHLLRVRNIYRDLRNEVESLGGLPPNTTWLQWRYLRDGTVRMLASVNLSDDDFTLSLHRYAFDYSHPILLKGLIHHELLHIVLGSAAGHGPLFRSTENEWAEIEEYLYHRRKFVREIEIIERNKGRLLRYECPNCRQVLLRTRPMKPESACLKCCKALNDGIWCESYTLIKVGVVGTGEGELDAPQATGHRQETIEENDERQNQA